MKVPSVMDLHSLQHLPDAVKRGDLQKILLTCLPSLPNMPDLHRLGEELKTSLTSVDLISSLSGWHILQLLTKCLPERFSYGNHTEVPVLVMPFFLNS